MKKVALIISLVTLLSLPFMSSSLAGKRDKENRKTAGRDGGQGTCEMVAALPFEDLSEDELAFITFMREEEKLARDVYLTLSEDWDLAVFANIAASEQRHMDAVGDLIAKYNQADPVIDDTVGTFSNGELAELYTNLTAAGRVSVVDALLVGATIEDLDIGDLIAALAVVDNADIQMVFGNLLQGSANHFSAFTRLLEGWGESYEPENFEIEELESIVGSLPSKGRAGKGSRSLSRMGRQGAQGSGDGAGARDGLCRLEN